MNIYVHVFTRRGFIFLKKDGKMLKKILNFFF